jgi:hypothetical protein
LRPALHRAEDGGVSSPSRNRIALVAAVLVGILVTWLSMRIDGSDDGSGRPAPERARHQEVVGQARLTAAPRPTPDVTAGDGGLARRLVFKAFGTESSVTVGLEVDVSARCSNDDSTDAGVSRLKTDGEGTLTLVGIAPECELELAAVDSRLALHQEGDDVVSVIRLGTTRVEAVDLDGKPLSGVSVEGNRRFQLHCVTGADGHCDAPCGHGEGGGIELAKPGYQVRPALLDCESGGLRVTLHPGRRLTVLVQGAPGPFLAPLSLALETDGFHVRRSIDAPGRHTFDSCTREAFEVGLGESGPALATVNVPAGEADVEVSIGPLEPRRLDVWVESDVPEEYLGPVWVECAGATKRTVMVRVSNGGKSGLARLEYAPAGPCELRLARRDADPPQDRLTVMPPAVATLKMRHAEAER